MRISQSVWLLLFIAVLPRLTTAATQLRSPYEIIEQAPAEHWRDIDPKRTVYIELATGMVVVELLPEIAPAYTGNFLALIQQDYYTGATIYRVVDGFAGSTGFIHGFPAAREGKEHWLSNSSYR